AAAPVRRRPPRRAGQAPPARGDRAVPGTGRGALRLLGPGPVLAPLQAPCRRHAGAFPGTRKNRLTGRKSRQETAKHIPLPFLTSSVRRRGRPPRWRRPLERPRPPRNDELGTGGFRGGRLMIPSGLTSSVIHRARLGDGYVRVRDGGVITAV